MWYHPSGQSTREHLRRTSVFLKQRIEHVLRWLLVLCTAILSSLMDAYNSGRQFPISSANRSLLKQNKNQTFQNCCESYIFPKLSSDHDHDTAWFKDICSCFPGTVTPPLSTEGHTALQWWPPSCLPRIMCQV